MKKLVREFEISAEQQRVVAELACRFRLTETTAGILYSRGIDTEEKLRAFLSPSSENYLPPLLLRGMGEAVELITRARDEEWRVAVFGDYDADGIGACAVISRALKRFGIDPYLYVPERTDGYGLSVAALDKIFDEFLPDLVITVDCGISCREEIEYIKAQGAYAIVTDHHELPDELPDCIIVNPKRGGDYPYDNLCGAGVAFKLAQALIGEEAYDLVDFAALSTVADSVPLIGENRDIVSEGLKRIASEPRPAFSALLGKGGEISAQTLAFTIAPRVNAAGRMGDANAALALFTSEDEGEIYDLAVRLNAYNLERQKACDELYTRVRAQIIAEGAYGNVIMLAGEDWNTGFVGIVAARIAEEFCRPALLFVRRGGMLKGSARSIERVNIFEALKACAEYIAEFGGHAQAAGVNVAEENFEALKTALNAYIGSRYTRADFTPSVYVAGEAVEDARRFAKELTLLEPCGIGNRRPLFYAKAGKLNAAPLKEGSPHVSFTLDGFDYVYFGGAKDLEILRSDLEKQIVFEYNLSKFRGKEYVKGFVRCVLYDGASGREVELDAFENSLRLMPMNVGAEAMEADVLEGFLKERTGACAYGLAVVTADRAALTRFSALADMELDVFRPSSQGAQNAVIFGPAPDCDLMPYREIVVLGGAACLPPMQGEKRILHVPLSDMGGLYSVDCTREVLLRVFAELRRCEGVELPESYAAAARRLRLSAFSQEEVVFALAVFEELGLLSLARGRLEFVRGKHTELAKSAIYSAVSRLKEGS